MRLFNALRGALTAKGIEQKYLAELMDRGESYISHRFTGKKPWNQDEQYTLMDIINEPYEKLHFYFPKNGR